MTGEKNILTTKNPHQIGVTSGTSGKSSLIPTTADVNRTFVTRGVFVIMNTMFDAYPGVRTDLFSSNICMFSIATLSMPSEAYKKTMIYHIWGALYISAMPGIVNW